MRPLRFRDQQQSRRFLVETVHDAGTVRSGSGREIPATPHECIHERSGPVPRRRVHYHSRGFVDDEKLVVLEDDRERYRLRRYLANGSDRGLLHYDPVTGNRTIARLLPRAIYRHVAVGDERCRLRSRKRRSIGYNKIEANVSVRLDGELVPLPRAQIS